MQKAPPKPPAPENETGLEVVGNWVSHTWHSFIDWVGPLGFVDVLSIVLVTVILISVIATLKIFKAQSQGIRHGEKDEFKAETPFVSWENIAGCEEAISSLQEVVSFLANPGQYSQLGARVPKGVLLHGPPGTGKTLLARAVAANAGASFYSANGSSFVEVYVGTGAARIRRLFKEAREVKGPAVIFIDEIDAIAGQRGNNQHGGSSEYERALNQLLAEIDGFSTSIYPVVVIGATNLVDGLDKALLRPGRMDRKIHVPPPDLAGREKILGIHTEDKPLARNVSLKQVARRTTGMSGADLANVANEAAIIAGRRGAKTIRQQDLLDAVRQEVVGQATKRPLTERERRLVAFHEAGHTVAAMALPDLEAPVESVTIVPHSNGSLGHTLTAAEEDRHLSHKAEVEARLVMLLAGRAGELHIGEESNGATGDMQHAYKLARNYVGTWGWGDHKLLWPTSSYDISDLTRRELDEAAAALAAKALQQAKKLLREHAKLLKALAEGLLEQETLEREEIEKLCAAHGVSKAETGA